MSRRKFKAIQWPGPPRPWPWYVVEVNGRDGSYYPRSGPSSKGWAIEEANRLQTQWDDSLLAAKAAIS